MSHSQFHSTKLFILRHAWLNLWDKHMTTGRINQVTLVPKKQAEKICILSVCFLVSSPLLNTSLRSGSEEVLWIDRPSSFTKMTIQQQWMTNAGKMNSLLCSLFALHPIASLFFFPRSEHWKIKFFKAKPLVEDPFDQLHRFRRILNKGYSRDF
jgi:hypothetical protein